MVSVSMSGAAMPSPGHPPEGPSIGLHVHGSTKVRAGLPSLINRNNAHPWGTDRITMYADRMKEVVRRSEVIDSFLNRTSTALYLPPTVESIYLQLRVILELIATASLIVNDDAKLALTPKGRRKWHAGDILAAVKDVNPDFFYPKPIRAKKSDKPSVLYDHIEFEGEYLTIDRFNTLYDISSKIIHTPSPLDHNGHQKNYEKLLADSLKWRNRIRELLIHHEFRLVDDDNMYVVLVRDEQHEDPVVWTFAPTKENAIEYPKSVENM